MTTLKHPRFADVSTDVADEDVARWVAAGWIAPDPEPDSVPDDPDPAVPGEEQYDNDEETS